MGRISGDVRRIYGVIHYLDIVLVRVLVQSNVGHVDIINVGKTSKGVSKIIVNRSILGGFIIIHNILIKWG